MFSRVTLLLLMLLYARAYGEETNSSEINKTLNNMFHGYDRFTPPPDQDGDGQATVSISVSIKDVFDISELDSSFSVRYYFTLLWNDQRLRFSPYISNGKEMNKIKVPLDRVQDHAFLWDIFLHNDKNTASFKQTQLSIFDSMFAVLTSGDVYFSREFLSNVRCQMDLQSFPHDTQTCTMRFWSYSYTLDELNLTIDVSQDNKRFLRNGAYSLEGLDVAVLTTQTCFKENSMCHDYAEAVVKLTFKRQITFYVYQVFLPTVLVVTCSWLPFWIDIDIGNQLSFQLSCCYTGNQVSLGVLLMLTLVTITAQVEAPLPQVPYLKAVDAWMSVPLIIVVAALLEGAVGTMIENRNAERKRKVAPSADEENSHQREPVHKKKDDQMKTTEVQRKTPGVQQSSMFTAKRIRLFSRALFPAVISSLSSFIISCAYFDWSRQVTWSANIRVY